MNTIYTQMLKKRHKAHLSRLIDDSYGSPEELAKCLDLRIEMLFYIEEDTFDRRDVQKVVSALRGIVLALRVR